MNKFNYFAIAAVAGFFLMVSAPKMEAQVSVDVGVAPDCPYGYYDVPPYACAPYGYYGPEWFTGGVFIGAGPWYHGDEHFVGHVDHNLDYRKGYKGPMPERGAPPAEHRATFKGQAVHDPHGKEAPENRK